MTDWATTLVWFGAVLIVVAAAGGLSEWLLFRRGHDHAVADGYPGGDDREPTDDEIYNGYGREGGISYDVYDEPGSLGEHDFRL